MKRIKLIIGGLFAGSLLMGGAGPAIASVVGIASMSTVADAARSANDSQAKLEAKIQERISNPKYAALLADPYFTSAEFRAPIIEGLKNEEELETEKKRILEEARTTFAEQLPLTQNAYKELESQFSQQTSLYNDATYKMQAISEAENVCEGGTARSEAVAALAKKYLCPTV